MGSFVWGGSTNKSWVIGGIERAGEEGKVGGQEQSRWIGQVVDAVVEVFAGCF